MVTQGFWSNLDQVVPGRFSVWPLVILKKNVNWGLATLLEGAGLAFDIQVFLFFFASEGLYYSLHIFMLDNGNQLHHPLISSHHLSFDQLLV